jgi:glycosyltransferase involved in cell wall biosynthesis
MSPEVSVIIPTYNRLWALPQAVESCRNAGGRTEIVVVDDGSTDGTWDWLLKQSDVIAIRQDNWGKDWAVNRGFAAARGEFIRFLDSDDWILPGANEKQMSIGRSQAVDVVVAGYSIYDERTKTEHVSSWTTCDDFIAQQLGECDSSHYSAYLFRKSFIQNIVHRQEFEFRDDRLFVIEVALCNPTVAIYDAAPTIAHRHHDHGRLQFGQGLQAAVRNWQHLNIYKKSLAMLEERGELTPRRIRAAVNVLWPLTHWIAYTNLNDACEVARWIYQIDAKFVPPNNGLLGLLYRRIGFRRTEQILKIRRFGRRVFRS